MDAESESELVQRVRLAVSQLGVKIWRNNVGVLRDRNGKFVRYGLCVGSSDLIGVSSTGKFVAIECKMPKGVVKPEQQNFIDQVKKAGGIAGIVRSEQEAIELFAQSYTPTHSQRDKP